MNKPASQLLPVLALLLSACQPGQTPLTATAPPEPLVCTQWLPLSFASRHDSALTIAEIRRANARRQAYCAAR